MSTPPISIALALSFPNADQSYLDEQSRLLRDELEHHGIATSTVVGPAPAGARGAAEILGLLQLALLPTLGPKLLDLLQTWLANRKDGSVKLKVKRDEVEVEFSPEHTSWEEIDTFLQRTHDRLT
jgi:hypothetical protein